MSEPVNMEELLTERLQQLEADNERLRVSEMTANSVSDSVANPVQQAGSSNTTDYRNPVSERYVFVPRERKCPRFSGKSSDGSLESRHMSSSEQALFVYDHLDGEAKTEIKFRAVADRKNHNRILDILVEIYGCSQSYISLQKQFFQRRQLEGESLREFSHSLLSLMEVIKRRSPTAIPNADHLVRDQFIEHVRDSMLRRELKRSLRFNPDASFLTIRSEAIRWVEEGEHIGNPRARAYSCDTQIEVVSDCNIESQTVTTKPHNDWVELKETLSKQQAQLDLLLNHFALTNTQPTQSQPATVAKNRPVKTYRYDPTGKPICIRCNQAGHIARFCRGGRGSGGTGSRVEHQTSQRDLIANMTAAQGN